MGPKENDVREEGVKKTRRLGSDLGTRNRGTRFARSERKEPEGGREKDMTKGDADEKKKLWGRGGREGRWVKNRAPR